PDPAPAATPGGLLARHDPNGTSNSTFGETPGFFIGGIQGVVTAKAQFLGPTSYPCHGKSEAAAPAAEVTSGPAPTRKKSVKIPDTAMMAARLKPIFCSKAGAG